MYKSDNILDQNSCLNKADEDEPIFTLLARDEAFLGVLGFWIDISREHEMHSPEKIAEAEKIWAAAVEWRQKEGLDV